LLGLLGLLCGKGSHPECHGPFRPSDGIVQDFQEGPFRFVQTLSQQREDPLGLVVVVVVVVERDPQHSPIFDLLSANCHFRNDAFEIWDQFYNFLNIFAENLAFLTQKIDHQVGFREKSFLKLKFGENGYHNIGTWKACAVAEPALIFYDDLEWIL
jgi:hypothetical protein